MSRFNDECIVLKNINYRDSDKIFTLYSKKKGKFIATGRGVRKIASRRGGNLDTMTHVMLGFSEDEKGYKSINEAVTINSFSNLKRDLKKSLKGYYILELIHRFIEENEPNEKLFDVLIKSLKALDLNVIDDDSAVVYFEINLMRLLGYGLTLDKCLSCDKGFSRDWEITYLNLGRGGFMCSDCGYGGLKLLKNDAIFLNAIHRQSFPKDIKKLTDADGLIKTYVRDILEGNLKSLTII